MTIRREDLDRLREGFLGKRRWYRPLVHLLNLPDGGRAVVKDFLSCPRLLRATYGRLLVGREVRAYAALEGVPGVPRFLGRIDDHAAGVASARVARAAALALRSGEHGDRRQREEDLG